MGQDLGHVTASVVDDAEQGTCLRQRIDAELRVGGGRQEAFAGIDVGERRVVDGDEFGSVQVDDLLQLVADLQDETPRIRRGQMAQGEVLIRVGRRVPIRSHQVPDDGAPEKVGDEAEALAVPGVEDRTRGALPVDFGDPQAPRARRVELGLAHAAGPEYADEFHFLFLADAEVQCRRVVAAAAELLHLPRPSCLHFDAGTEAVGVAAETG